jgi:ribosomal protein L11 methyltransferase
MALVKLVVRTPRKLSETVSELLFAAGAGGIEELDGGRRLVVYAATRQDADGIAARTRDLLKEAAPGPHGIALNVEVDEHSDWATAWTEHLGQVALTPTLVIQPLKDETAPPPGATRIWFDPKLAFGDGGHATTRLAAAALERHCRARAQADLRVLDFGSGTGVLAFVALLNGAEAAWGVDIDPVSVAAARRNAELNDLSARAHFSLPSELDPQAFELVIANLEAPALLSAASDILRLAETAKNLILTGFLENLEEPIAAAFAPRFEISARETEADWCLLELARR